MEKVSCREYCSVLYLTNSQSCMNISGVSTYRSACRQTPDHWWVPPILSFLLFVLLKNKCNLYLYLINYLKLKSNVISLYTRNAQISLHQSSLKNILVAVFDVWMKRKLIVQEIKQITMKKQDGNKDDFY